MEGRSELSGVLAEVMSVGPALRFAVEVLRSQADQLELQADLLDQFDDGEPGEEAEPDESAT